MLEGMPKIDTWKVSQAGSDPFEFSPQPEDMMGARTMLMITIVTTTLIHTRAVDLGGARPLMVLTLVRRVAETVDSPSETRNPTVRRRLQPF